MSTESTASDRRKKHLLHVARITLGVLFLILGVVGSLLPVLQGWVFFLFALITFFPEHPRVAKIMDRTEPKLPRLVHFLRKLGIGVREESSEPNEDEESSPTAG